MPFHQHRSSNDPGIPVFSTSEVRADSMLWNYYSVNISANIFLLQHGQAKLNGMTVRLGHLSRMLELAFLQVE